MKDSISLKDIQELIKSLPPKQESPFDLPFLSRDFGMPIIESPHIQDLEPVIKLSDKIQVSDEFRRKTDRYYVERFGYRSPSIFKTQYGLMVGSNFKSLLAGNFTV